MRTFWGAGLLCCPPHPHTHRGSPTTETAAGFRLRPHSYGTGREAGERPPGPALARNAQDQTRRPEAQRVRGAHASPTTHTRGLAGGTEPQTSSSGAGPALSRSRPREQSKRGAETAMSPDVVLFGCWGNTHARGLCLAAGKFIKDTLTLRAPRPLLSAPPPEARGTDPSPSPVAKDRCLGLLR